MSGGGWKVDEDETDAFMESDLLGRYRLPIEDFISDSDNTNDEQIDEDLLDELAVGQL